MDGKNSKLPLPENKEELGSLLDQLEVCSGQINEEKLIEIIKMRLRMDVRQGVELVSNLRQKFLQRQNLSQPNISTLLIRFASQPRDWLRDIPDQQVDPSLVAFKNTYEQSGCIMVLKHLTFVPGYDDVETLTVVRIPGDRFIVLIGDDSIEWYLQFAGYYPYSPNTPFPRDIFSLYPGALEACLQLWLTYFKRFGGDHSDMARLLEMFEAYYKAYPASPEITAAFRKVEEDFAKRGTLQELSNTNNPLKK